MRTLLHRFTVKPGHLDQWLALWPEEVALRRHHGYTVHRGFVETDAEPKVSWLYTHPEPVPAEVAIQADPAFVELAERKSSHVFRNATVRPVDVEVMTEPGDLSQTAIMRRYSITGCWDEFLLIWRRIVPLRERHGFPCLFAVVDRPKDMFTWAFGFDGDWEDFPAAQQAYYHDPERVALRGVFDYLADYSSIPLGNCRWKPRDPSRDRLRDLRDRSHQNALIWRCVYRALLFRLSEEQGRKRHALL